MLASDDLGYAKGPAVVLQDVAMLQPDERAHTVRLNTIFRTDAVISAAAAADDHGLNKPDHVKI